LRKPIPQVLFGLARFRQPFPWVLLRLGQVRQPFPRLLLPAGEGFLQVSAGSSGGGTVRIMGGRGGKWLA
jgi:hypothetical protein